VSGGWEQEKKSGWGQEKVETNKSEGKDSALPWRKGIQSTIDQLLSSICSFFIFYFLFLPSFLSSFISFFFFRTSVDDWEKMIDINCKGLLYATKVGCCCCCCWWWCLHPCFHFYLQVFNNQTNKSAIDPILFSFPNEPKIKPYQPNPSTT
jgi:hypothetical protein